MTLRTLRNRCARIRMELPAALMEAERESLKDAEQSAHELSQGPYTRKDLRRLRHPYSKRRPRPFAVDIAVINRGKGRFDADWQTVAPALVQGRIVSKLRNNNPVAQYLAGGTDKMISRPTIRRIRERIMPARKKRIARVLKRYLGPIGVKVK